MVRQSSGHLDTNVVIFAHDDSGFIVRSIEALIEIHVRIFPEASLRQSHLRCPSIESKVFLYEPLDAFIRTVLAILQDHVLCNLNI